MGKKDYPDNVVVRSETVTPAVAQQWLEDANIRNRPVRRTVVDRLAEEITRGEWVQTADLIAFDWDHLLVNGQHRLLAIIQADRPVRALVGYGLAPASYVVTDGGVKRTAADHFDHEEIPNSKNVAAVARYVWRWEKHIQSHRSGQGVPTAPEFTPTPKQLLERYWADPIGFQNAMPIGIRVANKLKFGVGMWGAMAYRTSTIDVDDSKMFMHDLAAGTAAPDTAPYFLREKLLASASSRTRRMDKTLAFGYTIKAWNLWRVGWTGSKIVLKLGGAHAENFPSLDGDPLLPVDE